MAGEGDVPGQPGSKPASVVDEDMVRALLPVEAYRSPEWFDREQACLFTDRWVLIASSEELDRPGAYVTGLANVRDAIPFPRTPGNAKY